MQHPLLGSVDPVDGPDILDDTGRPVPEDRSPPVRDDVPVIDFPAPEPVPQPPSVRRIAKRLLAGGLRRLSRLADKLDSE